jgi:hypothetical protein
MCGGQLLGSQLIVSCDALTLVISLKINEKFNVLEICLSKTTMF